MAKACFDQNQILHKEKKNKDLNEKLAEQTKDKDDLQQFTLSKELKWTGPEI